MLCGNSVNNMIHWMYPDIGKTVSVTLTEPYPTDNFAPKTKVHRSDFNAKGILTPKLLLC